MLAVTQSRSFKRVRARNLPDFVFPRKKLRGTVVHVSPDSGTFEVYHQPLFRSLFWIDMRKTGALGPPTSMPQFTTVCAVQFRKDTISMQLAGLNLQDSPAARHRFKVRFTFSG